MVGLLTCIPSQSSNACTIRAGKLQWLDQCCKPPRGLKQAVGKSFYKWMEKKMPWCNGASCKKWNGRTHCGKNFRQWFGTLRLTYPHNSSDGQFMVHTRAPPHGPCESFGYFGNCWKICENKNFENNENNSKFWKLWKNDQKCFVPLVNLFHRAVEHCSTRCLPVCRFFDLPM